MAIEEEFTIEIPDEEADKITTVGQAIDYIANTPEGEFRQSLPLALQDGWILIHATMMRLVLNLSALSISSTQTRCAVLLRPMTSQPIKLPGQEAGSCWQDESRLGRGGKSSHVRIH